MELIKKYVGKNKGAYISSVMLAILGIIMSLISYIILAEIIVQLIKRNTDINFYSHKVLYILVLLCLKEIFAGISTTISHTTTFKALKEIRKEISKKLFSMPLGDIMNMQSGRLKDIIVDQVDHMETTLAHIIPEMTANIIGPILLLVYMFILDWRLAILSLLPIVIGIVSMKSVMNTRYQERYAQSVKIGQSMNNAIVEYINGIEVIKTFNQSKNSYKKYSDAVYENASFYYNWMKESMMKVSVFRIISPMGLLTILPFGVYFYMKGTLDIITFITIVVLSFGTVENILKATNYVDDLSRIGTITREINAILNSKELNRKKSSDKIKNYNIKFTNVDFSYEKDKKVLNNVNLTMNEKEVTALVGPSGGGKSTIAKLIAGFWDISNGELTIGDVNIKNIPLQTLSEIISYVSQDNFLFDISIRDNIRVGNPNASDKEVEIMAKKSGCDEFIRNLPNGYETIVGEGGGHLSGGERQRISIARAMLKNAPIVILDEATSYMDTENENIVQKAISRLVKDKTLIIIAHRLRTITDADKIIIVKNGTVESVGTHVELLQKSYLYQEMWNAARKGEL
ncbi:ABC transporter ATP-binding protein [Clostridium massiliodielmoense]|uniref:ABC transporter ATP-binding protein n=1 Tax=Clostridium massiliodielmoense TaxID=1776385 RepID=UPI0004D35EED|nr:ABC transporter ATP-binding protein [Clostridium massiliodielmoense]KEH97121.1 ABC transporter ATP-binding protein [Clostridium botulinum C/D str. BKT12695]